jgi:hypothetical protein
LEHFPWSFSFLIELIRFVIDLKKSKKSDQPRVRLRRRKSVRIRTINILHDSILRSVSHSKLHLILIDGEFEELPQGIRQSGPWQGVRRGPLEKLNLKYRPCGGQASLLAGRMQGAGFETGMSLPSLPKFHLKATFRIAIIT